MKKTDNIISIFLILNYTVFLLIGKIIVAKVLGVNEETLNCDFNKQQILIYSIFEFLKIIDNIIISVWIFLNARKSFSDYWFYSLIGLVFGLIGLIFYLTMNLINGKNYSASKINKISVLIIVIVVVSILLGFYYRVQGQILINNLFGNSRYACLIQYNAKLDYSIGSIEIIARFLVSIYISTKIFTFMRSVDLKPTIWIIATLVLGIIPWILVNIITIMKRNFLLPPTSGYSQ